MKQDNIPQDSGHLEQSSTRELCYAVDENGNYVTGLSTGWDVKNTVLDASMAVIQERVEWAKNQLLEDKKSPILYYMELNKMDLSVLSGYMGTFSFLTKRHFNPKTFKNLSQKTLEKYAKCFKISVEELRHTKDNLLKE